MSKLDEGILDIIDKFLVFIIKNDKDAAKKFVKNHPELKKHKKEIKKKLAKAEKSLDKANKSWDVIVGKK